MFAKWRAQHSHNADKGVPSPVPFPFYGFRFGWVRFGSVQFSSVCWLFGFGAALVVPAFVAIVVVATGSDLALFALQSSPPTQRQLLLATCCLLLAAAAAASFSTYNGNMHVSNYGAQKPAKQLQQQLWNNRKLLAADDHHHHHRRSEWWTTKRAKCEPCADASPPPLHFPC